MGSWLLLCPLRHGLLSSTFGPQRLCSLKKNHKRYKTMGIDVTAGVDASKKAILNYAIPMIVGAFVVAIVVGLLKK